MKDDDYKFRQVDHDNPPWDIKTLKVSLGGEDSANGWLVIEIFHDGSMSIDRYDSLDNEDWTVESIHLDVARRLRDFLNYAVPGKAQRGESE